MWTTRGRESLEVSGGGDDATRGSGLVDRRLGWLAEAIKATDKKYSLTGRMKARAPVLSLKISTVQEVDFTADCRLGTTVRSRTGSLVYRGPRGWPTRLVSYRCCT